MTIGDTSMPLRREFRVVLKGGETARFVQRDCCDAAAPESHLCNRGHRLTTFRLVGRESFVRGMSSVYGVPQIHGFAGALSPLGCDARAFGAGTWVRDPPALLAAKFELLDRAGRQLRQESFEALEGVQSSQHADERNESRRRGLPRYVRRYACRCPPAPRARPASGLLQCGSARSAHPGSERSPYPLALV